MTKPRVSKPTNMVAYLSHICRLWRVDKCVIRFVSHWSQCDYIYGFIQCIGAPPYLQRSVLN